MYRNCIFCSAALGTNETIEHFPVGRTLAFDSQKGRLWVVCSGCGRWNLSPIEERWEAVEEAERTFRDSRMRVMSENIGLARTVDGTRLVRVGDAVSGELAAWRYGGQLVRRRQRYFIVTGLAALGATAFWGGIAMAGAGSFMVWGPWTAVDQMLKRRVVHRIQPQDADDGRIKEIRRWHLQGAYLSAADDGEPRLHIPDIDRKDPKNDGWGRPKYSDREAIVEGDQVRSVLRRAMVHVNRKGANQESVKEAVQSLADSGSASSYLRKAAEQRRALGKRKDMERARLPQPELLALEMALHEESELRALRGELVFLRAAWKEAEEIAAIADVLPFDRLKFWRDGAPPDSNPST